MQELTTVKNEISFFNNPEFGNFRGMIIDNEPYFVGRDIAECLGYSRPHEAIQTHCKGAAKYRLPTNGGMQEVYIIPESDIYRLIFGSKLPNAQRFIDWVAGEVLPSIRKHGAYMTDDIVEKAISNPDFLIRLATELKQEKAARVSAENKIQIDRPKVVFAEAVQGCKHSIKVGELAKLISQNGRPDIGQKRLFAWLKQHGYLFKNSNEPTQKAINLKVIEVKERVITLPDGSTKITRTPLITGKGQIYFIEKFLSKAE